MHANPNQPDGAPSPDEIEDVELALPTVADYDDAEKTLQRGFDQVEDIAWRLQEVERIYAGSAANVGQPPARADVGALWSYVNALEGQIDSLTLTLHDLSHRLALLNLVRLDSAPDAAS